MDSFKTKSTVTLAGKQFEIYSFAKLKEQGYDLAKLPYAHKVLLENLLRNEGASVSKTDIESILNWKADATPTAEISFTPARVLLQDFTGVPCVVDLAAMRDAMSRLGGDPKKINPLQPAELVIDHSVQVDAFGNGQAVNFNLELEFERNAERYRFLKWGQSAFNNFKVVPPNTGICHQVNLEYLGRVVFESDGLAYLDSLVGTDSHTTMINGLGVLGWGVGGIEAEAAMLGQPISMLLPQVVGFKLTGRLREGATATDLVLTVTEMLRKHQVVGKFVEFYGPGIANLPLADRATIANMAPEYGATCGLLPVDEETLRYMMLSGRSEEQVQLVKDYFQEQGLFHTPDSPEATYSSTLSLNLADVEPSVAGPKRPQDRAILSQARKTFFDAFPDSIPGSDTPAGGVAVMEKTATDRLTHGSVVIAAITSCTNTSNPSVMVAAGLVARKAHQLGLKPRSWVKTSLAPGSKVVTRYLTRSKLSEDLDALGFNLVGYGCTTCIGNSGPLPEEVSSVVRESDLTVVSVLSGNRNFEGRINQDVKANYLMSPPLVVAYALAGTIDIDLSKDVIATTPDGKDVTLADLWPTQQEIADIVHENITRDMFAESYSDVFEGDDAWKAIDVNQSELYGWTADSTYVKQITFFDDMGKEPSPVSDLTGMRCLAKLGDSVTTDHISPAGAIKVNSPAGEYLIEHGVKPAMFNSYGSRRGNHEVMVRGTFANIRLKNMLAPGTEGGFTTSFLRGELTTIFDASVEYQKAGIGLYVLAGKEYGTGSSRDWAAKGVKLLGVQMVLAVSFERIHRSNLIGMGVLPVQFLPGESAESHGLTGEETLSIAGLGEAIQTKFKNGKNLKVSAISPDGKSKEFEVLCRLDTDTEMDYYHHGGVLQYVLRKLLKA